VVNISYSTAFACLLRLCTRPPMFRSNESNYSYIEAKERCPMSGGDANIAICFFLPAVIGQWRRVTSLKRSSLAKVITWLPLLLILWRERSVRARGRYGGPYIHGTSFREFNIASYCKRQPCVFLYQTLCNEVPYTGEDPSPTEIQWLSCVTDKNS